MIKRTTFLKIFVLMIVVISISGCTQKPDNNTLNITGESSFEDKNQEFVMTGKLSKSGNLYLLTEASGKVQDLESYTVEFDNYLGKTVTVTGEYSGDTLFVTNLK